MQSKILSVSIACYNTENYIRETVESLLTDEESIAKLEIILVNDGSKDGTSRIAHEYEKKYPDSIIVIDKPNGGYGSTINASLAIASGKYYKLLDGDDWFDRETLNGFLSFLESTDADVVITPFYRARETRLLADYHTDIPEMTVPIQAAQIESTGFLMHEITVNTDLLRGQNWRITEHCFYTDAEYAFLCILCADSIARYPKPVYCYRLGVTGQSVSVEGIRKHQADFPIVAEKILAEYSASGSDGKKRELLDKFVIDFTYGTYRSYMLLKKPLSKKQELIAFDKHIQTDYPKAYAVSNGSRLVRVARKTGFRFYGCMSYIVKRKYLKTLKAG